MQQKEVYVTQPTLPPMGEFIKFMEEIWSNKLLTNVGPFHQRLETELAEYLDVPYVSLVSNGTLGLMIALRALDVQGEVITTPYSFVATAHSIVWNHCKPVFVDIERTSMNLDPSKIEAAITKNTTAIMPVHCYGNPSDYDKIQEIADRNKLKVIYDAAHAFGVSDDKGSILNHGDLSVLSFHATKVFNTIEGGALISKSKELKEKIDKLRNFGFENETSVTSIGINAKMSEVNAAFGVLQLQRVSQDIKKRQKIDELYRESLRDIYGLSCLEMNERVVSNYSYFPIYVNDEYPIKRDELFEKLKNNGINARRYFYPSIHQFSCYLSNDRDPQLPVAENISSKVLCLPLYPDLHEKDINRILNILKM